MVLVDTSVWIEVFRKTKPLDLEAVVQFDDIVTCLPIVQEVLQGIRDDQAFQLARVAMRNLPHLEDPLAWPIYERAVDLYRTARKRGITVRSSIDCLIAACALTHGAEVLHRDRDFVVIAKFSGLRERQPRFTG